MLRHQSDKLVPLGQEELMLGGEESQQDEHWRYEKILREVTQPCHMCVGYKTGLGQAVLKRSFQWTCFEVGCPRM